MYCKAHGKIAVEDETHFLLKCPMSNELREKYLPKTVVQNNLMRDDEKLIQIMKNADLSMTAKFIYMAFEHREITLDVLNTIQDLTTEVVSLSKNSTQEVNSNVLYEIYLHGL